MSFQHVTFSVLNSDAHWADRQACMATGGVSQASLHPRCDLVAGGWLDECVLRAELGRALSMATGHPQRADEMCAQVPSAADAQAHGNLSSVL